MRSIVMFDLPTETNEDKRNYRQFRKVLIKNGFVMMQESVYTKVLLTPSSLHSVFSAVEKNKPPEGLVQMLTVTEKQFAQMMYIVGKSSGDVIDNDERLVIL